MEICAYHFNNSIEDCLKICTTHVVLQCDLPAAVLGSDVKSVKYKGQKSVSMAADASRRGRAMEQIRTLTMKNVQNKYRNVGSRKLPQEADLYLLKTSKARLGAGGMLHVGVGDCVGQQAVVRTLTVRSTPQSDSLKKQETKKDKSPNVCNVVSTDLLKISVTPRTFR